LKPNGRNLYRDTSEYIDGHFLVPYLCNRGGGAIGFIPVCMSVCPSTKFCALLATMCAAIALKLCTLLYIYDLQIKFKYGCYRPIFGRVIPVNLAIERNFTFFCTFLSLDTDIHLIFGKCTLLCHTMIQIKFEFGFYPIIFHEVKAFGFRKISRIISFPHFFLSAYRYSVDIWYIALPYQDTDQV
jgi:hypothetical protein